MVFGEKVRTIPSPERNWVLGSLPIKEVLTKNLEKFGYHMERKQQV